MVSYTTETLSDRFYRYLARIKTPGHAFMASSFLAGLCSLMSVLGTNLVFADIDSPILPFVSALAYLLPFVLVLGSSFILIRGFSLLNQRNKILSEVADRDGLTRLANRAAFSRRGREMALHARLNNTPLSMIMIDVDHFKNINDRFGHLAGDLALQHLADVLKQSSREQDLPARWGGEEFAILLKAADTEGARLFAERVRKAVADSPLFWNGKAITLTLSAGVAQFDPQCDDFDEMVYRADRALYSAKSAGRNQVRHANFYPEEIEGYEQDVEFREANVA